VPSRPVQVLIVLFWLATAGWYVHREIAPYWIADAAPAFAIDLTDEAVVQSLPVRWTLSRSGQKSSQLHTSVQYHDAEDEFSLNCVSWNLPLLPGVTVENLRSSYRVTRQGRLVETNSKIIFRDPPQVAIETVARISGSSAVVTFQFRSPWGNLNPESESVPVMQGGVINPLHPVHRLNDIRPGQHWVQSLTDPLADAQRVALRSIAIKTVGVDLKQFIGDAKPKRLIAEVTGPTPMKWHGELHDCNVIEYRGDDHHARTWVRVKDGRVLRQEAFAAGDEWTLQRD
jgi:hypothetical protein